jgi:hypothetical protein
MVEYWFVVPKAESSSLFIFELYFQNKNFCFFRLMVRTLLFQGENMGSIPIKNSFFIGL